jgi:hypothetical protein
MWFVQYVIGKKNIRGIVILCIALSTLASCAHDDHNHDDEEKIVTMTMILTDTQAPSTTIRATWSQPGGPGTAVTIDTLQLQAGRSYTGRMELIGATGTNLTQEIRALGTEHQFFFTPEDGAMGRVIFTITDRDTRSLPLGLEYTVAVQAGSAMTNGRVRIELNHFDDPSQKNGTTRSNETDIDIRMPIRIR